MKLFPYGHATHPQWRMACALVLTQLRAHMALPGYASSPTLGLLYITDHYAAQAQPILDFLSAELPEVTDWSGTVGVGVASNNVEYFDEPALCVMLCDLPPDQYRVFSGVAPLSTGSGTGPQHSFEPNTALVHADAGLSDVTGLIAELAQRTRSGYLFGGIAASRSASVQFAISGNGNIKGQGAASGVFSGGLCGVAFGKDVALVSRLTQGCRPVPPVLPVPVQPAQFGHPGTALTRTITACDNNVVTELDGQPALDTLLAALQISLDAPQTALTKVRNTLVGLEDPAPLQADKPADGAKADSAAASMQAQDNFGDKVRVRHIIGLDLVRRGIAIADAVVPGMRLTFCERNVQAARADLVRVCTEIREELEPQELPLALQGDAAGRASEKRLTVVTDLVLPVGRRIVGAIYISCSGRGGPYFGEPSAELHTVRRALGDVPLVGFFAGGEIAHQNLYGYCGVLTVFTTPA